MASETNTFGQPRLVYTSGTFTASHTNGNSGSGSVSDAKITAASKVIIGAEGALAGNVYVSSVYAGGFDWYWQNSTGALAESAGMNYVAFDQDTFSFGV
jgi:hypothetical protein